MNDEKVLIVAIDWWYFGAIDNSTLSSYLKCQQNNFWWIQPDIYHTACYLEDTCKIYDHICFKIINF